MPIKSPNNPSCCPSSRGPRSNLLWLLLVLLTATPVQAAKQIIDLQPGWNLIAFQVIPQDSSPAATFATPGIKSVFQSAWSYDVADKRWRRYTNPSLLAAAKAKENELPSLKLGPIEPGKGYWVYISASVKWELEGNLPADVPSVVLKQGWNLIGIPAGRQDPATKLVSLPKNEKVNMLDILKSVGSNYDMLLQWEASLIPLGIKKPPQPAMMTTIFRTSIRIEHTGYGYSVMIPP